MEEKNIFRSIREEKNLSRKKASELLPGITEAQLEKLETGKTQIRPEDVLLMAKGYSCPKLINYYCHGECPIGQKYVDEVEEMDLSLISIKIYNAIENAQTYTKRLMEIADDGKVMKNEVDQLNEILNQLKKIVAVTNSLQALLDNEVKI